jgi:signal transduction histidine kinase
MTLKFQRVVRYLGAYVLGAAAVAAHGGLPAGGEMEAALAPDARSYRLEVPGVFRMDAGFGVDIERNGQTVALRAVAGPAGVEVAEDSEQTPYGRAAVRQVEVPFAEHGCTLLFRWGRVPGLPGVLVQAGARNTGGDALRMARAVPVAMAADGLADGGRVALDTKAAHTIRQPLGQARDDLSANREPLRIAGEIFTKGIGCHAPSEMIFPLDGRFARFQCLVGVDDAGNGSVSFEVHVDGKKLFDSGLMRRGQAARVIDLEVTDGKELRLVTTDGGDGTQFDWADWVMPGLHEAPAAGSAGRVGDAAGLVFEGEASAWMAAPMVGQKGGNRASMIERAFEPVSIEEAGGFYDHGGRGLFFGPVGQPVSYLAAKLVNVAPNRALLEVDCPMDMVVVEPGQTRWGQQAVLLAEPPAAANQRWVAWVARTHGARPARDPLSGWLSWYWLNTGVTENDVRAVVDFAKGSGGRLRPAVIQLDDGYQTPGGYGMNAKFPSGPGGVAEGIAATGAMPGLMITIYGESPDGVALGLDTIRRAVADGFRYLKLNRANAAPGANQTRFEAKRELFAAIRAAAGEDTYLLAADDGVDRACVGTVDAKRVRVSAGRHEVPAGMDDAVLSLALNRQWFTVDNDCYYLAADAPGLPQVAGGTPFLQTWLSLTGLACGNAMTSDPWHWESLRPSLRHTEILTPPARESARAIDLGATARPARIVGHIDRPWGRWTVAMLWNPGPQAREITLDFAAAGMDHAPRYAVWSFWENRFLGIAEKSWTTPALEPLASQHLCFTSLDGDLERPRLIGSNLHIWCGAAEFGRVTALHRAMEIQMTDAGARDGDLFVRCATRPEIRLATGCGVTAIEPVAANIWRIAVEGRRSGVPQRIELGLRQSLASQPWFWLLVSLLAVSLAIAGWRYAAHMRAKREIAWLQQKNALEEERSRIARDLHDELGANLVRISLLTELAGQSIGDPEKTRHQLDRIHGAARAIVRQLDSVVWAVDPANDTLESLARYLHGHAEEYLAIAGIRCGFEADPMPAIPLSSAVRHNILMIVKEALNNVVKHAGASAVETRMRLEGTTLVLEIEDNGKGIAPAADGPRHGNGLRNMRKRAAASGGTCTIHPAASGKGTVVRLVVPLCERGPSASVA